MSELLHNVTPGELLASLTSVFIAFCGALWHAYKTIMNELRVQTGTLSVLGHRSSEVDAWRDSIDVRVHELEKWRNKQSGIIEGEGKSGK